MEELVRQNGSISVKELSQSMGVSDVTVRRDLDVLQADNRVQRSHGKAVYQRMAPLMADTDYELRSEQEKQNVEKDAIGRYAVRLIEPGDVLFIDTGSTTDRLAKHIPEHKELTVFCYNYNILTRLIQKEGVDIIFGGGFFYPKEQLFLSDQSIELVRSIRANKLFLSASGVHETLGITCAKGHEVPLKRAVLDSALTKILLADSSKFSNICPAHFAQISEIDIVVTDAKLSASWQELLKDMGIEVHFAI